MSTKKSRPKKAYVKKSIRLFHQPCPPTRQDMEDVDGDSYWDDIEECEFQDSADLFEGKIHHD